MTIYDRDEAVAEVIGRVPVPEHGPQFWERLEARLEEAPVTELRPAPAPADRRTGRWVAAAAALAAVVAAVAIGVTSNPDDQRVSILPATTAPATPATTSVVQSPPGSDAAVLRFLDALGNGDIPTAASLLGPRSEAYLTATTGSVQDFLRGAQEGYGAWARSTNRTTRLVEVRPGDVVVVVSGTVTVEGNVEQRTDAFPARYAESARTWFVEGWAFDPATGGRMEVLSDPGQRRTGLHVGIPVNGTAWLSVDGGPAAQAAVTNRNATWTFPAPLPPGNHLFVVAFVNDSTFTAMAISRSVGP